MSTASYFTGNGASFGIGDEVWALSDSLGYHSATMERDFHIPMHFWHDFGSVPRILRPIVPNVDGIADRAYVLHDFLVRNRQALGLSLLKCHMLMHEAMECLGVPEWKRRWVYRVVYAFGWTVVPPGDGSLPNDMPGRIRPIFLRPA